MVFDAHHISIHTERHWSPKQSSVIVVGMGVEVESVIASQTLEHSNRATLFFAMQLLVVSRVFHNAPLAPPVTTAF